jgi:hypothetical protein
MAASSKEEKPTPQSIAAYVKSNAARARKAQKMVMAHGSGITREADYKGHHIVIETTYQITVDGKRLMGHMGVNEAGAVHYHPIPNLSFPSAIDMVEKIIDVFSADFAPAQTSDPMPGIPGMPGMGMKKKAATSAKKAKRGKK